MRRIITGHNSEGKSIITLDGPPARTIGEDVGGLFEIWNTDGNLIDTTDSIDRADTDIVLSPPENGSKFRYFQINPTPEGVPMEMMQEIAADAFEKIGAAHHRVDTSKHPAMHKADQFLHILGREAMARHHRVEALLDALQHQQLLVAQGSRVGMVDLHGVGSGPAPGKVATTTGCAQHDPSAGSCLGSR